MRSYTPLADYAQLLLQVSQSHAKDVAPLQQFVGIEEDAMGRAAGTAILNLNRSTGSSDQR
jgi:hypothetical protein